jgi:hypothetical protein
MAKKEQELGRANSELRSFESRLIRVETEAKEVTAKLESKNQ